MTDYRNLSKQWGTQGVYNVVLSSRDLIGSPSTAIVQGKKKDKVQKCSAGTSEMWGIGSKL
jgi:hypothetical protein